MGARSDLALASQRAFESGFCEEEPEGSLGARRLLPPPPAFLSGGGGKAMLSYPPAQARCPLPPPTISWFSFSVFPKSRCGRVPSPAVTPGRGSQSRAQLPGTELAPECSGFTPHSSPGAWFRCHHGRSVSGLLGQTENRFSPPPLEAAGGWAPQAQGCWLIRGGGWLGCSPPHRD